MPGPTRVLFIDDSADICDLYRRMIDTTEGFRCVGVRESTVDLEQAIEQTQADVAVIDLVGPGRDALEAIRVVSQTHPRCALIAFSGHDDDLTRDAVLDAGAWCLVSKHADPQELLNELRRLRKLLVEASVNGSNAP